MLEEDDNCSEIPVQTLASKTTTPRKTARVFMLMNPLIPVVGDVHEERDDHEESGVHEGGDSGSQSYCSKPNDGFDYTQLFEERRNFKRLRENFAYDERPKIEGLNDETTRRTPSMAKSPRFDGLPLEPASGSQINTTARGINELTYRPGVAAARNFSDSMAETKRIFEEAETTAGGGLRNIMIPGCHPLESENSSGPHVLEKLSRVTEEDEDDEEREREADARRWMGESEDPFHRPEDREAPFPIPVPNGPLSKAFLVETDAGQKFPGNGYEGNSGLAHRQEPSSGDDLSGPIPSVVGCRGTWTGSVARSRRILQTEDEACAGDGQEEFENRGEFASREVRWISTMSWLNRMADQQESLMTDWDSLETKIRQFQLAMTDLYQCKTQLYFKLESVSTLIQSSLKALRTFAEVETQRSKEERLLYAPGSETTFSSAPCVTFNSDVSYDQSHPVSAFEYCESPRLEMARFSTAHSHSDVLPESLYPKAYFQETNQPPFSSKASVDDHTTTTIYTGDHLMKCGRTSSSVAAVQSCRCGNNTAPYSELSQHGNTIPPKYRNSCARADHETLLNCRHPCPTGQIFSATTGEGVGKSSRTWSDCSQSSSTSSFRQGGQQNLNLENFPISLCNERLCESLMTFSDCTPKAEVYPRYLHSFSQLAATGFGDLPPVCANPNTFGRAQPNVDDNLSSELIMP